METGHEPNAKKEKKIILSIVFAAFIIAAFIVGVATIISMP